jgi:hypothetical protein
MLAGIQNVRLIENVPPADCLLAERNRLVERLIVAALKGAGEVKTGSL